MSQSSDSSNSNAESERIEEVEDEDVEMAPEVSAPAGAAQEAEVDPEEYDMLDAKLDDLNSVLDVIEQKNDRIHAEFAKLLQSNREIREELQRQKDENQQPQPQP